MLSAQQTFQRLHKHATRMPGLNNSLESPFPLISIYTRIKGNPQIETRVKIYFTPAKNPGGIDAWWNKEAGAPQGPPMFMVIQGLVIRSTVFIGVLASGNLPGRKPSIMSDAGTATVRKVPELPVQKEQPRPEL